MKVETLITIVGFRYALEWIITDIDATTLATPKNLTQEEAYSLCNETIRQSPIVKDCINFIPDVVLQQGVEDCGQDVWLSGETIWIEAIITGLKQNCILTVLESVPANETLPPEIVNDLCTDPCQHNGTCILGMCDCTDGFTGTMCEISQTSQATVYKRSMVCDYQNSSCASVLIRGESFYNSATLKCILEYEEDGGTHQKMLDAEYISEFHVRCPTPIIGMLHISVSNDGVAGSSGSFLYFTYNSSCQTCAEGPESTVACEIMPGKCFIHNLCFDDDQKDPNESCNVCSSDKNNSTWTRSDEVKCQKRQISVWIICVASLSALMLLGGTLILLVKIWQDKRSGKYTLSKRHGKQEMTVFTVMQSDAVVFTGFAGIRATAENEAAF